MAQVNIRIDDDLKAQGDKLFNELGLNFSSAVNVFIAQAIREQAIPFKVALNETPNKVTIEAIREGEKIIAGGKSRFNNAKEMFDDLGI